MFLFYRLRKNHRSKELAAYIQSATDTLEIASKGEIPLPMALIRLVDGEIVWSNQRFGQATGMKQRLFEQKITTLLPTFTTDWLAAGKSECPYDLTVKDRRYRCDKEGFDLSLVMVTDILQEATYLLFTGSPKTLIGEAFKKDASGTHIYLPGVMSRKKQVIPMLTTLWG